MRYRSWTPHWPDENFDKSTGQMMRKFDLPGDRPLEGSASSLKRHIPDISREQQRKITWKLFRPPHPNKKMKVRIGKIPLFHYRLTNKQSEKARDEIGKAIARNACGTYRRSSVWRAGRLSRQSAISPFPDRDYPFGSVLLLVNTDSSEVTHEF
jgi:hypothetical protein